MSGLAIETDLLDGVLTIDTHQTAAALAAVESALGAATGSARGALADLGFTLTDEDATVGVVGFRGVLEGPADDALAALAPFGGDEQALLFEDDNGVRWRYLFTGGQLIEQTPTVLWRDVNDRTPRTGGVLAPLTLARDPEAYAQWWKALPDTEAITEALAELSEPDSLDTEHTLSGLMCDVFQQGPAVSWLQVTGLRRGHTPSYIALDIDPAHDGDGIIDGVDVVVNLSSQNAQRTTRPASLTMSVYVSKPRRTFQPTSTADPSAALAEIIDIALAMINREIADQDRATFTARDCLQP